MMCPQVSFRFLLWVQLLLPPTLAFSPYLWNHQTTTTTSATALFGLTEWREVQESRSGPPLLLLPYAESDILLPGQACQVVLKEGRHFDMVEEALEEHQAMIGQAVMGDDRLASTLSLCEIIDTDVDSGYRGKITMTIELESVGRASLEELLRLKPVPQGHCKELKEDWTNQDSEELLHLKTEMEEILSDLDGLSPNDKTSAFRNRYDKALLALSRLQDTRMDRGALEASSWAVFAALSTVNGSFEPRCALEIATASDRLRYGLDKAKGIRATKLEQAEKYSLLDDGVFE